MDRSGAPRGQWPAPSYVILAVDRLCEGVSPADVWELVERRITYRTLLRWSYKETKLSRRYILSKWWLANRERIETLERRGLSRREIIAKVGWPNHVPEYSGANKQRDINQFTKLWMTLGHMEDAENERWMGRDVAA